VADFANATGDAVFDDTLRQGLEVQLRQSPFLNLVSQERIRRTLNLMGRAPDTRLTPDVAREVCQRTTSAAVLDGAITPLGSEYVVGLRARNCRTGDLVDEEQAQADRKEEVLNALTEIAARFRAHAGESLATVERHSTPLAEETTSSLDALKIYTRATTVSFTDGFAAAVPLLTRAVDIDPQFAMAHALLGLVYHDLGEAALSMESTTRAYRLRDRVSDHERFFIEAMYDRNVTGNLEKERQTLESWLQTYPRDVDAHGLMAGFCTSATGRHERTIDEARKAIALDPDYYETYQELGSFYFKRGEYL